MHNITTAELTAIRLACLAARANPECQTLKALRESLMLTLRAIRRQSRSKASQRQQLELLVNLPARSTRWHIFNIELKRIAIVTGAEIEARGAQ